MRMRLPWIVWSNYESFPPVWVKACLPKVKGSLAPEWNQVFPRRPSTTSATQKAPGFSLNIYKQSFTSCQRHCGRRKEFDTISARQAGSRQSLKRIRTTDQVPVPSSFLRVPEADWPAPGYTAQAPVTSAFSWRPITETLVPHAHTVFSLTHPRKHWQFRGRDRKAFPGTGDTGWGGRGGSDGLNGPGGGCGKCPEGGLCERGALGRYGGVGTAGSEGYGRKRTVLRGSLHVPARALPAPPGPSRRPGCLSRARAVKVLAPGL